MYERSLQRAKKQNRTNLVVLRVGWTADKYRLTFQMIENGDQFAFRLQEALVGESFPQLRGRDWTVLLRSIYTSIKASIDK